MFLEMGKMLGTSFNLILLSDCLMLGSKSITIFMMSKECP